MARKTVMQEIDVRLCDVCGSDAAWHGCSNCGKDLCKKHAICVDGCIAITKGNSVIVEEGDYCLECLIKTLTEYKNKEKERKWKSQ